MTTLHVGDLVHINKVLPSNMTHFTSDKDAIILEKNGIHFALHIKGKGFSAWYSPGNLKLKKPKKDVKGLLKKWKAAEALEEKKFSDLKWIFKEGKKGRTEWHGASIVSLGKTVGANNLWGSHGEGYTFYRNAFAILAFAQPFLNKGDLKGYLAHVETVKAKRASQP